MNKKDLKKLLIEIAKEKKLEAKAKEKKQAEVSELMDELVKKATKAVLIATKAGGEAPDKGKPDEKNKEKKVEKFFKALIRGDKAADVLVEGTDSAGGYLVPDEFRADIVDWAQDKPVIRRFATVWPMKGKLLELPALAADVAVYWGSENTSLSTTSAEFGNVTLTPFKLNAIIFLTVDLLEDSAINLVSYLTDRFAQAIYREEDRKFVAGTGSGQPTGLSQASINSTDAGNAGNADKLIETYWRLSQSHRENGVWLASNTTLMNISKLKNDNGDYLMIQPTTGGLPTIMGKPVMEQNDCAKSIYFGDLRFYYIGDRRKMTVKTTSEGAGTFLKDQVAIKVTERVDGKLALGRAMRKITNW